MIRIPKQLQNEAYRFIKIQRRKKHPYELKWEKLNNYQYNEEKFKQHLKEDKNYGVVSEYGNLIMIDCDEEELSMRVTKELPPTFTILTGGGGKHFYYTIKDTIKKTVITNSDGIHLGEVQASKAQCVGPNSIHPNGNQYEIVQDLPIMEISKTDLLRTIKPYVKDNVENLQKTPSVFPGSKYDIAPLADTIKGLTMQNGELVGAHPIHGSTGGTNFRINLEKNTWYCFRCGAGGDAISLAAVLKGHVKCEECVPGYFRSHPGIFLTAAKEMKNNYNYNNRMLDIEIHKATLISAYRIFNEKGFVNYPRLGKLIKAEMKLHLFICNDEATKRSDIFYYDAKLGHYKNNGIDKINFITSQLLDDQTTEKGKNEVVGFIKDICTRYDRNDLEPPVNLINLKNGILNIDTMELLPHSHKYKFLSQIPVNWNPQAVCPKIDKFLTEILQPDDVLKIKQVIGFIPYRRYRFQCAFIFFGSGSNGKGTVLNLVTRMIGSENLVTRSLEELTTDPFAKADLYGKMANLGGEMSYNALKDCRNFKALVGEDRISAQKKYRDSFNFTSYAKLIFNTNKIPYVSDKGYAFYRRIEIISFLKTFEGDKMNTRLLDELSTEEELEGLLVQAMNGLKQLLKSNKFYRRLPVAKMEDLYEGLVELESEWIQEHYETGVITGNLISLNDMYAEYLKFTSREALPFKTKAQFKSKVVYLFKQQFDFRVIIKRKKQVRSTYFVGLNKIV